MVTGIAEAAGCVVLVTAFVEVCKVCRPSADLNGRKHVEEVLVIYKQDGKLFGEKDRIYIAGSIDRLQREAQELEKSGLFKRIIYCHRRQNFNNVAAALRRKTVSLSQEARSRQALSDIRELLKEHAKQAGNADSVNNLLNKASAFNAEDINGDEDQLGDAISLKSLRSTISSDVLYGNHWHIEGRNWVPCPPQPLAGISDVDV